MMFNFYKSLVWLKAVSLFLLFFGLIMLNSITFADDELELSVSTPLEEIDQSPVSHGQVSECKSDDVENYTRSENNNGLCETIIWQYDTEMQTLSFTDENVWLNCCGERTIVSFYDEKTKTYEIQETDDSINGQRCFCMCFYDFKIDIPNIATEENIKVKLTRAVDNIKKTIWEGSLNMRNGQGAELTHNNIKYCN